MEFLGRGKWRFLGHLFLHVSMCLVALALADGEGHLARARPLWLARVVAKWPAILVGHNEKKIYKNY